MNTSNLDELKSQIGNSYPPSDWVTITQDMIDLFAKATLDPDLMHIDPQWCKAHSPFGTTIAFGFLTIGLLTHMHHNITGCEEEDRSGNTGFWLNCGLDRLRLIKPVPVNSRLRLHMRLKDVSEKNPGELRQIFAMTMEIEGEEKPAMVADWLLMWVQGAGANRVASS